MIMGDAADDARDTEEMWEELQWQHKSNMCDVDCPYCNPDFEPLFEHQVLHGHYNEDEYDR